MHGQLQDGTEAMDPCEERTLLRRICRNVTGTEIHDLPEERGASLDRLPDDAARTRSRAGCAQSRRPWKVPWQLSYV